ncbi:MAG: Glycine oxidase ThiO [Planctomycetaceae bacterium]|nr:Glycine oxidase ThiO [Planctomycetaceae bacterium]
MTKPGLFQGRASALIASQMNVVAEPHPDVLIVGGGVIGLSIAYFLATERLSVTVLDQGQPGQEASWAGAGMLPPGNLDFAQDPASRLRGFSHRLWAGFSRELREMTGIDNGYVESGGIELAFSGESQRLQHEAQGWRDEGVAVETLSFTQLRHIEPAVNGDVESAYRLRQFAQVRNPRHVKALVAACLARGVRILPGCGVLGFKVDKQSDGRTRVLAARTIERDFSADKFVVAGGAWTQSILAGLGIPDVPISPVRGQIVLLSSLPLPFSHVLNHGSRYLVPRTDGRILIGSTEEHVGFDKSNTAAGVAGLLEFGQHVIPKLANAKLERTWSGLRPGSPIGSPYLCQLSHSSNAYVAAGHFRSGLQLSPGTGRLMAQLITGRQLELDLAAFQLAGPA